MNSNTFHDLMMTGYVFHICIWCLKMVCVWMDGAALKYNIISYQVPAIFGVYVFFKVSQIGVPYLIKNVSISDHSFM